MHHLLRIARQEGGWINRLYLADGFSCWTIARDCDAVTPDGVHTIKIIDSPKFGPGTIWICRDADLQQYLAGVPYSSDKLHHNLMHNGATAAHSTGCEVVGREFNTLGTDTTYESRATLDEIKKRVKDGDLITFKTLP